MKPFRPFEVWLTTVQSGSCVPAFRATVPLTQGGCSAMSVSSAMRCNDGAKSVAQIDSAAPFAPNSLTSWLTRTPGSAKLWPVVDVSARGRDDGPRAAAVGRGRCLPVHRVRRRWSRDRRDEDLARMLEPLDLGRRVDASGKPSVSLRDAVGRRTSWSFTSSFGALRDQDRPPATGVAELVAAVIVGGPSCDMMVVFEPVSNRGQRPLGPSSGDAEQSSSLVIMMIARYASGRRNPWFSAGGSRAVGAERAQDRGELALVAAAALPSAAMQVKTSLNSPV